MVPGSIRNELLALLLQDLPESIVFVLAVFSLLAMRFEFRKVAAIASLQAVTNPVVRLLPVAFGMHSVLLVISLALYTRLFTRAWLSRILLAVLFCFAVTACVELVYTVPLLRLTGLEYKEAFANPFLRAAFALPYELVLLALALGKNYYNAKKGLT